MFHRVIRLCNPFIYEIHTAMQQNVDIESTERITITTDNIIHTNLNNIIRQMNTHDADLQMSKIKLKLCRYRQYVAVKLL